MQVLQGRVLNGAGLADLLQTMVDALNARDIPSSTSILFAFNQQLIHELVDLHSSRLEETTLPTTLVRRDQWFWLSRNIS